MHSQLQVLEWKYSENHGDVIFGDREADQFLEVEKNLSPQNKAAQSSFSNNLSIIWLPSANIYISIKCHSKIKQIPFVPQPPLDATPFLFFSQQHSSEELPVFLIYSLSSPSFSWSPSNLDFIPISHRAFIQDFHIVNSSDAFSIHIMHSLKHLVELIAPASFFWKKFFKFILFYF